MHIEPGNYRQLPTCYRLYNDDLELIVTADVGPRIIRFGFVGGENEFYEAAPLEIPADKSVWTMYGGHRLWHAPEVEGRTTAPDNDPVIFEQHDGFVRLIQPREQGTGIRKEIDITLHDDPASVTVTHRMRNDNLWAVELALWAPTIMKGGGTAIIPLPPRGSHPQDLQAAGRLTLWAYTDLSDPRWRWGRKYIQLRQDSAAAHPQKVGTALSEGWAGYVRAGHLFVKTFAHVPGATYPEEGSSFEVFTNTFMLEMESLAPTVRLEPGATAEHVERWYLFRDVPDVNTDDEIDAAILPLVERIRAAPQR